MYLDISSLLTPPSVAYDPSGATFCTTNGIKAELVRHFVFSQYNVKISSTIFASHILSQKYGLLAQRPPTQLRPK